MPKLPVYTAKELIKLVEQEGFVLKRQSGSHMIFSNEKGLRVVIPNHGSKNLHPKIVKDTLDILGKLK
jgi:predicted RNA binding protein YcfA (HicA-like mRNA interferase family)